MGRREPNQTGPGPQPPQGWRGSDSTSAIPEKSDAIKAIRARVDAESGTPEADRALLDLIAALVAERRRQGLHRDEMIERSGLGEGTILALERGRVVDPKWATLRRYALGLGMRVECRLAPLDVEAGHAGHSLER